MSWTFPPLASAAFGSGSWSQAWSTLGYFLSGLGVFAALAIVLGKSWCGWLCPFGVVQDWVTRLRRLLGIREAELGEPHKRRISKLKYVLLLYMTLMPILYSAGLLSRDFVLAFCNICPAKILMPLTTLDASRLGLMGGTSPRALFSVALLAITGGVAVGIFLKERFFCLMCPMLAMINVLGRFQLLRLSKEPSACRGCGGCRRTCSMDNSAIWRERISSRVQEADCLGCFTCAEGCATDGSLSVKFGPATLFTSSSAHAARALAGSRP
jgi:polyferredoxin